MLKKCVSAVLALAVSASMFSFSAGSEEIPEISAKSAVVIEARSGRIIYSKNENEKLSMASTTKIMTSLLALESGELDTQFKVTDEMIKVEGSSMGLLDGDTVTMRAIVYGMLLLSGNDAANVAAYKIAGSIEDFAVLMNERAREIGMLNTNFVTPSGLDDDLHYSTAYDMALLGAYAVNNPSFREICSSVSARVEYGNPPYARTLTNHNRFLSTYDGAFGIKTGFTKKSGRCLVTAVQRNGITLVAVTLNAPDDWNDHGKMYDYAFSRVKLYAPDVGLNGIFLNVVGSDIQRAGIETNGTIEAVIFDGEEKKIVKKILMKKFEYAPIKKGDNVGFVRLYLDGELVCEVGITVSEGVSASRIKNNDDSFIKKLIKKMF